jgi:L-threonylcarbamoyladenylate synthase
MGRKSAIGKMSKGGVRSRLQAAAAILRRGGVVAFPTETFYALGADPRKPGALRRLRGLKGRERRKPLLLLAASRAQALSLAAAPRPPALLRLARLFWPGPLTLIVRPRDRALARALGRAGGLAVRVTSHPLGRRLIRACGHPLTGTSANRAGDEPPRQARQAGISLRLGPEQILDGGRTRGGLPSTIVDLSVQPPRLVREGAVRSGRVLSTLSGSRSGRRNPA